MKCLTVHVDLNKVPDFNGDEFLYLLRSMGRFPEVDRLGQGLLSFNFFTENLSGLWQLLRSDLYQDEVFGVMLKKASIAVCESDDDSELLLFHCENKQTFDEV